MLVIDFLLGGIWIWLGFLYVKLGYISDILEKIYRERREYGNRDSN